MSDDSKVLLAKAHDVVDCALTKYEGGQPIQHSEETTKRINHFMDELKKILDEKISDINESDEPAFNQKIKDACRALSPQIVKIRVPFLDKWVPSTIFEQVSDTSREEYATAKMDYVRKVFNAL
ncbi:hypothetical protein [Gluconobacter oxydans]|uniref:hypothetical protein n=1 Tax=Gluconobacter oxydans TaxID=442 RepID=UPI0039E9D55E